MASDHSERGKYIRTGWRIVGPEADAIAERAGSAVERLEAGQTADTLYAVQFTLEPRILGRTTVERVLAALEGEIRATWPDCPRLQRDQEIDSPPSRFGGMRLVVAPEPGREWLGELIWRAVHPVVAGAAITTRVLIEERASYTRVNVRVTADHGLASVRGFVGAGQAQPAFLRSLRREDLNPLWLGSPLGCHLLRDGEVCDLADNMLASPERSTPLVILAPNEDGGYVVEPNDLAWDLLGRAKLYVLQNHQQSFLLSDSVGDRRMSCYWGAARAYLPGWSRHDDPYDHPLLVGERLADPVMRSVWLGELGVWLGTRLMLPASITSPRPDKVASTRPPAHPHIPRSTEDRTESWSVPVSAGPAAISDPVPLLRAWRRFRLLPARRCDVIRCRDSTSAPLAGYVKR